MSRKRPQQTIPDPYATLTSLQATVSAMKELVESMAGQRGGLDDICVTWQELIDLGLIKEDQVPVDVRHYRSK